MIALAGGELRRVLARRMVRVLVLLAVVGIAVAGVLTFLNTEKVTAYVLVVENVVGSFLGAAVATEGLDRSPEATFPHDLPPDLVAGVNAHIRHQSGTPFETPWPLDSWPAVATRFLLCRHDRFFPADVLRCAVRDRLGISPDEMDGGHLPTLARPLELADRIEAYAAAPPGTGRRAPVV